MALFKNCVQKLIVSNLSIQQLRFYPRWSHRTPAKVLNSEDYERTEQKYLEKKEITYSQTSNKNNLEDRINNSSYENRQNHHNVHEIEPSTTNLEDSDKEQIAYKINLKQSKRVNLRVPNKSKPKSTADMLETVIDKDGNYVYTKMQNKDLRIT